MRSSYRVIKKLALVKQYGEETYLDVHKVIDACSSELRKLVSAFIQERAYCIPFFALLNQFHKR